MTRMRYLIAAALLVWTGCDGANEQNAERSYEVAYRISSAFETCTISYANQAGDLVHLNDASLNEIDWQQAFSVTVQDSDGFVAKLGVLCDRADGAAHVLAGAILVDGVEVSSANEKGNTASFDLNAHLGLDGAVAF